MTMARYWSEVIKRFSISQVPLMDLGFSDKAKTCLSEVSCLSAGNLKSMESIATGFVALGWELGAGV